VRAVGEVATRSPPPLLLDGTRGLIEAVAALSRFPHRGRMLPEVGHPEIREIIYRSHRVVHRLSLPEVLTVRHARFAFAEIQKPE
jgi:hypothetical protein